MSKAIGGLFGGGGDKPAPAPVIAAKAEERTADFALREQSLGQRAAGAGATRTGNDADLLGYTLPRRRSAGRAILG
jgi:hypothetical protein